MSALRTGSDRVTQELEEILDIHHDDMKNVCWGNGAVSIFSLTRSTFYGLAFLKDGDADTSFDYPGLFTLRHGYQWCWHKRG